MVHKTKRRFTNEFKAQAVELVRVSGKTTTEIAKDLGIGKGVLCQWVRMADAAASAPSGEPQEQELKRLRKEVEILRMERDFLKKAAAFFAKESK